MVVEDNKFELVSVIVPTHNCVKFVKKTIDSVLKQTYRNFEIIVIDDCSTDGTPEIVKSILDKRISLFINEKQSGAAFSRNRGISQANGSYVAFLDGDDVWSETKIEEQLSFMKINSYSFSFTNYDVIDENDIPLGLIVSGPKTITHKAFMKTNYVGCSTIMYKRDIYPNLQIPNTIYKRNDYALWLKLSEKACCHHLDKVLTSYRKTSNSLSSGQKKNLIKYHKEMFQKLYQFSYIKASFFALRNVLYYFFRRMKYAKKYNIEATCSEHRHI